MLATRISTSIWYLYIDHTCICIGNVSGHGVGTLTTPTYNEILPSYSQAPNENKCNQEGLELQENVNTVYQVTAAGINLKNFELHKKYSYCLCIHIYRYNI